MKCVNHDYIDTDITCDGCSKPICGKCLKKKNDKRLCSLCYIKAITKKTITRSKKNKTIDEKKKTPFSTKSFDIDPSRLQSLIQNAQEKQLQSRETEAPEKKKQKKKGTEKVYCSWHKRIIAEYRCAKCKKDICRECVAKRQHREVYCQTCWSSIKYADVLAKRKK